jgi:CRISPR-associated protein Csm3
MKTKLRIITGLHIGDSDDTMKIGGIDSSVVKREIYANDDGTINYDGSGKKIVEPYIPGSSLKGKIRSLLEHTFGLIREQKVIYGNSNNDNDKKKIGQVVNSELVKKLNEQNKTQLANLANLIILLFGESAGSGDRKNTKITRTIFRDSFLTKESRKLYLEDKISLSEEKAENTINRVTVTANPRFIERVPAGAEFDFEVVLREFEEDKDLPLKKTLELGLLLLQNDALGGGGSRGNGKIEFEKFKDIDNIEQKIKELIEDIKKSL